MISVGFQIRIKKEIKVSFKVYGEVWAVEISRPSRQVFKKFAKHFCGKLFYFVTNNLNF